MTYYRKGFGFVALQPGETCDPGTFCTPYEGDATKLRNFASDLAIPFAGGVVLL